MVGFEPAGTFDGDHLPPIGTRVELLCRRAEGDSPLPFLCAWTGSGWVIAGTRHAVEFEVLGWRQPPRRRLDRK